MSQEYLCCHNGDVGVNSVYTPSCPKQLAVASRELNCYENHGSHCPPPGAPYYADIQNFYDTCKGSPIKHENMEQRFLDCEQQAKNCEGEYHLECSSINNACSKDAPYRKKFWSTDGADINYCDTNQWPFGGVDFLTGTDRTGKSCIKDYTEKCCSKYPPHHGHDHYEHYTRHGRHHKQQLRRKSGFGSENEGRYRDSYTPNGPHGECAGSQGCSVGVV